MTFSGSPDPDPGIVKRDEETLQRERDEKAEQDRLEEERRILEQEVPFWRRQKQLEGDEFTQDPEGPHYQSIAAETGIGIATDFATVGLLGVPVVGQGLYYGTNFAVGYGANALAQWMRGDWDDFSQGEALAAGGFQTIPMGTTAKGLKGLRRAAAKGAVGSAGMAQLEVGIDEQRRLTGQELVLSSILGGTVAGGFKSAELANDVLPSAIMRNLPAGDVHASNDVKLSTNEVLKRALVKNEVIRLKPAFPGGKPEFRMEADYFDVSAALIGAGQENVVDSAGNRILYDRAKVTEFGGTKSERRDIVYNHIKNNLKRRKKDGTGTNINRKEFNQYVKDQKAAEETLRESIKLLNIRQYMSLKGIDETKYPTSELQFKLLANINKAKHKPRRSKNKAGNYTETPQQFQKKVAKWTKDTADFQQYTDYKETFDYGHIISAKTGFRLGDLGMNRKSNTEIEEAHNVISYDRVTRKIIEILQEGNRERGSRRDHILAVQQMRDTSSSVIEDFVKWKDMKDGNAVNLTKILNKFIPREQHSNYLKYVQNRFYEKRKMSGSLKDFMENDLGIPYKEFKNFSNNLQLKIRKAYEKDIVEWGNVSGIQQLHQGEKWIKDSINEFIDLHHFSKAKKLPKEEDLPQNIDDLIELIRPLY